MQGATVWCYASEALFGYFLHRLEHYTDIHLIRVEHEITQSRMKVWLRSDRWPDWWEGVEMDVTVWDDKPRMKFVPRLSSKLDYVWRDQFAALLAKSGK